MVGVFCTAMGCASASKRASARSGASVSDDVGRSENDEADGSGLGEADARERLGVEADAGATAWTSASFSLPLARESDPNQVEDRLVGGEIETGNATTLWASGPCTASGASGGRLSDSTSGITGVSWGSSLVDAVGLEVSAGGRTKASILSRTLPFPEVISAPAKTQEIVGTVAELRLSFLALNELGGRQTLGRGDLVDAVLRMDAVEGCLERRGALCKPESEVVSRALMENVCRARACSAGDVNQVAVFLTSQSPKEF